MTMTKVHWAKSGVSGNKKTGPIFVTTSEMETCPSRCPFRGDCYASVGPSGMNWRKVAERGATWDRFVDHVASLPSGSLWRHNEAGDLPTLSDGTTIDRAAVVSLAKASAKRGKKGFTYTHHVLSPENVETLREVNAIGFTVNVSCETLDQVDFAKSLGLPATIVVPKGERPAKGAMTPEGAPVRSCPNETNKAVQCANCGICAKSDRSTVIAFEAHGPKAKVINAKIFAVRAAPPAILDAVAR